MAAAVPAVKITDNTDTFGIRCPDDKTNSGNATDRQAVGAQQVIGTIQPSFGKQMEIEVSDQVGERIRIMSLLRAALMIDDVQSIGKRQRRIRKRRFKESFIIQSGHRKLVLPRLQQL